MTPQDLSLVVGLVLVVFAVPSIMGAMSNRRTPRAAAIAIVVGGGLILYAVGQTPGGYDLADIPNAFVRVVNHFLR